MYPKHPPGCSYAGYSTEQTDNTYIGASSISCMGPDLSVLHSSIHEMMNPKE